MIYLVDPTYNPNFRNEITSSTKLGPGITMAKFLGSRGSRVQLEQVTVDKKSLARQLYLQSEAMLSVKKTPLFNFNRLIVSEGVYVPYLGEQLTPNGYNEKKKFGRTVVYQLIDKYGKTDIEKSFDLADYWKDYLDFEELVLDYDTYDPKNGISCQLVLTMPRVNENFDVQFDNRILTNYNGGLLSANEFLEIKQGV